MQRVMRAFLLLVVITFITGGCSTESTVDGTEENPYQIYTFADLLLMLEEENLGKHFLQMNDIDASDSKGMSKDTDLRGGFPGIGSRENPFTGSYDGNGYQITNLHFKYRDELLGFFRYIKDAEIKNLTIGKTTVTDSEKQLQEYFNRYENDEPDFLSQYPDRENLEVGGVLVAFSDGGVVWNCHSIRGAFGTRFSSHGGLVGYNGGIIAYSSSETGVGSVGWVGGLVSINSGTIRNSFAKGGVGGMASAGGLVGYNLEGIIIDSYSEGNVGAYNGGGLVARNEGLIERSAYLGDRVGVTNGPGGGLVGVNAGEIKDSYSVGDVSRHDWIVGTGGLVGENRGGTITRSFAAGNVSAYDDIETDQGGFAGVNSGEILSSYWNTESSGFANGLGEGDSDGITGLATEQMTGTAARDHMPEFDWAAVWATTATYPVLRWQLED